MISASGSAMRYESTRRSPVCDPLVGRALLERYTLDRRIHEGGSSWIYSGRRTDGRRIVVKVLRPSLAHNRARLDRFLSEGVFARGMALNGLVRAIETGNEGGLQFHVLERCAGAPLSRLQPPGGRVQDREAAQIILALSRVVADLNARECAHTRLCAGHVMVGLAGDRPVVHLLDLAAIERVEAGSPWVQQNTRELGALFYELLTGRSGDAGKRPTGEWHSIRPPSGWAPVDARWDSIVMRATGRASGPFRCAAELAKAIEEALVAEPLHEVVDEDDAVTVLVPQGATLAGASAESKRLPVGGGAQQPLPSAPVFVRPGPGQGMPVRLRLRWGSRGAVLAILVLVAGGALFGYLLHVVVLG